MAGRRTLAPVILVRIQGGQLKLHPRQSTLGIRSIADSRRLNCSRPSRTAAIRQPKRGTQPMLVRRLTSPPFESFARHERAVWRNLAVLVLASAFSACSGTAAGAQNTTDLQTCNAAICEDEAMVVVAVDAALDATEFCRAHPTRVLSTLHPAPYTAFSDGVRGRAPRNGLPSSPATLRLEDLGILSARRFRHKVTIVDSLEVQGESRTAPACLVVSSPPSLRDNGEMRVVVAVSEVSSGQSVQRFLFLRRDGARWVVSRHEVGYRS